MAAIVLGSGLALATTTKVPSPNYYLEPSTGEWKPIGSFQPGRNENQYTCEGGQPDMCTAETLSGQTPGGNIEYGVFVLH